MGSQDLPAVIDFILEATNRKKLHYVGHSMGKIIYYCNMFLIDIECTLKVAMTCRYMISIFLPTIV